MPGFDSLVKDLQRTAQYLERQLQAVREALSSLGGGAGRGRRGRPKGAGVPRRRRKLSADARRRISEAQKARWARQRAKAGKK
jgi:hypothetical protein